LSLELRTESEYKES